MELGWILRSEGLSFRASHCSNLPSMLNRRLINGLGPRTLVGCERNAGINTVKEDFVVADA